MTDIRSASILDVDRIREDFSILQRPMRGKRLSYLDNGATSLKPDIVVDEASRYYRESCANIHRGVYELSETATLAYDESRAKLARFIHSPKPEQVIFTKGTTESLNLLGYSWGRKKLGPGDEIVTTELEHHSNIVVWQEVAKSTGAKLVFLPLDEETGRIVESEIDSTIGERARLLAITGMSNVTGYIPPLKRIIARAHEVGAVVVVDGAQYVSHHPTDVQDLDVDFLAFSGHKMLGPTGVGALYGKMDLLEEMDPFLYGGDMIVRVHKDRASYNTVPEKFEAGTPNIAGVMGLAHAVDYLERVGMDRIHAHEQDLLQYTLEEAASVPGLTSYGGSSAQDRSGIFSFNLEGAHSHDVGTILDGEGVAVRTGFHCAQPLMRMMGIPGTVRASYYVYNDKDDVDRLLQALERVRSVFG
jgi:cysteine desulfurase/selenocysteine lyase